MFKKILVANRGEIAVRIIRACRAMGIATVAVYSVADRHALHVYLADESICIGPAQARESYLNMQAIISAAIGLGVDAIHPGYGFFSENSAFARACIDNGIAFIGPPPELIDRMGNKAEARKTMIAAGVEVTPGTEEPVYLLSDALAAAREIGWPIMVKASSGGGGKGMRISWSEDDFADQFKIAQRESVASFADNTMYLERYVTAPHHIEVQVIADKFGKVVALGDRDCSVQRNHQKMIEESPSPFLDEAQRAALIDAAIRAAEAVHYVSAGTIEFLVDAERNHYFMEMNTRIQVEHPVTEEVWGVDLVKEQLRVAAGERLSWSQESLRMSGHAIECRINAEKPDEGFTPSVGTISRLHFPGGPGVRIDSYLTSGSKVQPFYDSLLAKVITYGKTRDEALARMRRVLDEMIVEGVSTTAEFHRRLLDNAYFLRGEIHTTFVETEFRSNTPVGVS